MMDSKENKCLFYCMSLICSMLVASLVLYTNTELYFKSTQFGKIHSKISELQELIRDTKEHMPNRGTAPEENTRLFENEANVTLQNFTTESVIPVYSEFNISQFHPTRNDFVYERLQSVTTSKYFKDLLSRNPPNDDPQLLDLIRRMMDPPSIGVRKHSLQPHNTPQSLLVQELMYVRNGGFFVECGALDGERSSNTNLLESKFGWTGLLIEADASYYTQVLGKNRRAWSINACLSPTNRTTSIIFQEMTDGTGHLAAGSSPKKGEPRHKKYVVPCFTLESLMLALNRTTIDFFSLDVEGAELTVLKNTNFNKLYVKTMTVEYAHIPGGKPPLLDFARKNGFKFYKEAHISNLAWAADVFFYHKNFRPSFSSAAARVRPKNKQTPWWQIWK